MSAPQSYRHLDLVHDRVDDPATEWYREDFTPMSVVTRPIVEPGASTGPSVRTVYERADVPADETMFTITDNDTFRAGGYQRGRIWDEPSLLPRFSEYLDQLDPVELAEIQSDQRHGVDIWRDCNAEFIERVRPSDPDALHAHLGREVDSRNSARYLKRECYRERDGSGCWCFVCFFIHTLMSYLAQGTVRCLGLIANVRAEHRMPYLLANMTLEESKPRACYDSRLLNEATRDRPTVLEGLTVTRTYCQGHTTLGCVIDEKAGYSNHLVSDESAHLLGFAAFGYVWEYLTLPFGW